MRTPRRAKLSLDREEVSALADEVTELLAALGSLPVFLDPELKALFQKFVGDADSSDAWPGRSNTEEASIPLNASEVIAKLSSLKKTSALNRHLVHTAIAAATCALQARRCLRDGAGFPAILMHVQAKYLYGVCAGREADLDQLESIARNGLQQRLRVLMEPRRAGRLAAIESIEVMDKKLQASIRIDSKGAVRDKRYRERILAMAKELDAAGKLRHGWKASIARRIGCTATYVGKVFTEHVETRLRGLARKRGASGWPHDKVAASVSREADWSLTVVEQVLRKKN